MYRISIIIAYNGVKYDTRKLTFQGSDVGDSDVEIDIPSFGAFEYHIVRE